MWRLDRCQHRPDISFADKEETVAHLYRRTVVALAVLVTAALLAGCAPTSPAPAAAPTQPPAQAPTAQPAAVSFVGDVLPIFEQRCTNCYGDGQPKAGLSLKDYAGTMKGTAEGPVIKPGDAQGSELIE